MADVIVVGLGTMGSAAAEALARRGATVIGLDRWAPPHEHGAHSGGTRIMRLAYAEGASYVPLIRRSWELWEQLQGRAHRRLLTPNDALTIGRPAAPLLRGVLETVEAHGLPHAVLDRKELAERLPQFRLADDEIAVIDPAGATIYPEAAIDTCLSLAEVDGIGGYGLPWQDPPGGVKAAFHHPATGEQADVRAWLADRIPDLAEGDWLGASPCWYTLTPDEHFILGRHPAHDNVVIGAGFSGHGFKFMPVIGEILADLALTGSTAYGLDLFNPGRFAQ